MKKNYKLIAGFIVLLSLVTMKLGAQCGSSGPIVGCLSTSQYPSGNVNIPNNTPGVLTTITTCQFHEYAVLNFAAPGQYSVTNSEAGDWCTITTSSTGGSTIAAGPCPLSFTLFTAGIYYFHFSDNGPTTCAHSSSGCIVTAIGNVGPLPPCTSANFGSVAATATAVCPGGSTNLSILNGCAFTGFSGLSYQWITASTAGGPYASVPSATNSALTVTNITAGAAYELVATCANGPLTYTSPAITIALGVPAPGLALTAASQTMICSGSPVALSITNYAFTGVNYQYQYSTLGIPGTYTSIPSGTTAAFTATNNTVTSYFQAVVSCTANPTFSVATTPIQVMVPGTTTNTAPYFEGFENVTYAGQLPNCSWSQSTSTNVISTNIAANTAFRLPHTGTKSLSFAGSTPGTKYVYTNGIYLTPGITYSASIWYITESTGLANFTDLSLLYGTAQTPSGLTLIASTNGNAIAPAYASLSNTFQVTTAGLYYVAIKESNTASAYYLTVDDLAIRIPCSLNSPTLAVTGSTAVCAGSNVNLTATGADTYVYTLANSTFSSTSSSISNNPNQVSAANYQIVGTNTLSGCTSTVNRSVIITAGPIVSAFIDAPDNSVCPNTITVLHAVGNANSYVWSTTGLAGSSATISPTDPVTTYSVTGYNSTNCSTTATISITLKEAPAVSGSASRSPICVGESTQLNATGAVTYSWVSSAIVLIGNGVTASPSVPTIYALSGTGDNGCVGTANISVNVQACTGITSISASNAGISVYPNPTNSEFTVELNSNTVKSINITDLSGRVLMSSTTSDAKVNFNIDNLSNGVYFVKIQSSDNISVVKIVKQ